MSTIGLMILAAGASTRMGAPKQLLPFQGRSLLRYMAEEAIASCCDPAVVVLGSHAERMTLEVDGLALHVVENSQWADGMGTSIAAGITALTTIDQHLNAVIIVLCDQPFVSAPLLDQLVESYRATQRSIIASAYADTIGVPALFDRSLFTELRRMNANVGARHLIKQHAEKVFQVSFPKGAIDLDTPAQYQQLLKDTTVTLSSRFERHNR
ncbi:nucleotidyltransferase family protein [Phormidium sp. FACHB-592]|uniref:Nucleotidyltransferase family protein n=1 Tax=Stenomitos frigidus AS-A4 TaxID=2933935 RepID=A0ABV0KK38_9CYAN|nr:nucleotidyltransferase family protein [Phormidium sp. FACHB-592]MBD2073568.1 nucleotidyltransferase family protein [Phormidium sp. FACHB-592]